jgi:hypothetical protein
MDPLMRRPTRGRLIDTEHHAGVGRRAGAYHALCLRAGK